MVGTEHNAIQDLLGSDPFRVLDRIRIDWIDVNCFYSASLDGISSSQRELSMPHVAFVPFTGLRVGTAEMLAFGMYVINACVVQCEQHLSEILV
jgi:hypothetical protein